MKLSYKNTGSKFKHKKKNQKHKNLAKTRNPYITQKPKKT
jgi:hypothetical protein